MVTYYYTNFPTKRELDFHYRTAFYATARYLVNNHYYDKLIDLYEVNIPLLEKTGYHWIYANDQIWKKLQKTDKWYYFTERIGRQRDGYSDNTERIERYNC